MDQSPCRGIGRQKTATVIFNRECPKVVDRFRGGRYCDLTCCSGKSLVLSSFLCEICFNQFFEEWQVLTHFPYRV